MLETILLQAQGDPGFPGSQFVLIGAIFLVMYFFMLRPQQKKQKEQKKFVEEIKKGDQVITIGGLHGKVFSVGENDVVLEFDKGSKIKFEKTAISREATAKAYPKQS